MYNVTHAPLVLILTIIVSSKALNTDAYSFTHVRGAPLNGLNPRLSKVSRSRIMAHS